MAQFLVRNIPDAVVPDLARALADALGIPAPADDAGRALVAEFWCQLQMAELLVAFRANEAADAYRADAGDQANALLAGLRATLAAYRGG